MLSPLSSPPSSLPETSKGFGQAPSHSPESHKSDNVPPSKASQPSLPPLADVAAPPPSDSAGGNAPAGEPIVLVPNAPGNLDWIENVDSLVRQLIEHLAGTCNH